MEGVDPPPDGDDFIAPPPPGGKLGLGSIQGMPTAACLRLPPPAAAAAVASHSHSGGGSACQAAGPGSSRSRSRRRTPRTSSGSVGWRSSRCSPPTRRGSCTWRSRSTRISSRATTTRLASKRNGASAPHQVACHHHQLTNLRHPSTRSMHTPSVALPAPCCPACPVMVTAPVLSFLVSLVMVCRRLSHTSSLLTPFPTR